jgi:hypothetical protein
MVIDYKLVTASHPGALSYQVAELLEDGWTLYGSPVIAAGPLLEGAYESDYAQALVRDIPTEEARAELRHRRAERAARLKAAAELLEDEWTPAALCDTCDKPMTGQEHPDDETCSVCAKEIFARMEDTGETFSDAVRFVRARKEAGL